MGMTDIQFKDFLRRDLQTFEDLSEILNSDKPEVNKLEELQKKINKEIKRINTSLQD